MWGAGIAFVVDAAVSVGVSLRTRPRPLEELQGLVYGMANEDESVRRSNVPKVMGGGILVCAAILTIIFW
jgi:SSS family solute:Na+ symporter